MFKKLLLFAVVCLTFTAPARSQSRESATVGARPWVIGAEFSTFNPDWGCNNASAFTCWSQHLVGPVALIDGNRLVGRLGVEGEARWLHWEGPGLGLTEASYLVGPRYPLYRASRFTFYAKGLLGTSRIKRSLNLGQGSYFTIAPGGTVEYGLSWRMVVRAEYEYQFWPNFVGLPGQPANGLTPNGFSFGFGYRL